MDQTVHRLTACEAVKPMPVPGPPQAQSVLFPRFSIIVSDQPEPSDLSEHAAVQGVSAATLLFL